MAFSSIEFLYCFLPVTLLLYVLAPRRLKNTVLLIMSVVFYYYGERQYTLLLIISSLSDWFWSLMIEGCRGTKKAKVFLIFSIVINLSLLGFFKYADFFISSFNAVFGTALPLTHVPLPIGISFFTFQTMSYTIDVYRGEAKAQRNLLNMATYVCLFPQLVAGPIVRYTDLAAELESRTVSVDDISDGLRQFAVGLGKKMLLANAMGELCSAFRSTATPSVALCWIAALAYMLQVYLDFSAYSDMAIGLGRMFGFHFPINFHYPFLSRSISEFWQRWHITLGSWFRDYVYIPLGGNRTTRARQIRNLAVVWLLTGLWHGAAWNFVLWGVYFGVLISLEKLCFVRILERCTAVVRHIYVLLTVLLSFVIFGADGLGGLITDFGRLFGFGALPLWNAETAYLAESYAVSILLCAFASLPFAHQLWEKAHNSKVGTRILVIAEPLCIAALLLISTAHLVDGSFNPFLYFRF